MCVRYNTNRLRWERLIRTKNIWVPIPVPTEPEPSLFPGATGAIVRLSDEHGLELVDAKWGLHPAKQTHPKWGAEFAYNARSEGITSTASFVQPFRKRRCVVPVASYFEQKDKRWIEFSPANDDVFVVAGLWEPGNRQTADIPSFTMVTTEPSPSVAAYHDRMPVILRESDIDPWLDLKTSLPDLRALMVPYPDELIKIADVGPTGKQKPESDLQASLF